MAGAGGAVGADDLALGDHALHLVEQVLHALADVGVADVAGSVHEQAGEPAPRVEAVRLSGSTASPLSDPGISNLSTNFPPTAEFSATNRINTSTQAPSTACRLR